MATGTTLGALDAMVLRPADGTNDQRLKSVLSDFVSAASFQPVAKITTSAWLEHAPFAFWLIDMLRPQHLVELGVYYGFSYLAMCQAVVHLGSQTRCYGIDNWTGDEHAGFYGEEVLQGLRSYHDPLYSHFSQLLRGNFDAVSSQFSNGSVDLLHIDGRHLYEDVKYDFETWRPKLSNRAIVLFHDTNVRQRDFGVWKLWEQLTPQYPSFEFLHGYGLGVLGYGLGAPRPLQRLFAAGKDRERADAIRAVYFRLGALYRELERYRASRADLAHIAKKLQQEAVFTRRAG